MKKNTREKILEETFLLLLENGYDNVSVSEIQHRLGISRGLLYIYFKSKSDLLFEACRTYFFDRFMTNIDFEKISLRDFISHVRKVIFTLTKINGKEIDILKYNTLCSHLLIQNPDFKSFALEQFSMARKVIRRAIKSGEIKNVPESFVGATLLAILGRTSYITQTPGKSYVRKRILEDIESFYDIIKRGS